MSCIYILFDSSLDRSWFSLSSPHKTLGLTPTNYSQQVEAKFYVDEDTKRMKDLKTATREVRLTPKERKQAQEAGRRAVGASAASALVDPSTASGQLTNLIVKKRAKQNKAASDPFRPQRAQHQDPRPKLVRPYRSNVGQFQHQAYEWNAYVPIPNPALPPEHEANLYAPQYANNSFRLPNRIQGPTLKRDTFPYNTRRPTHHRHAVNRSVDSGYYTTHWDDRNTRNPYQPYEVEVIQTGRPVFQDEMDESTSQQQQPQQQQQQQFSATMGLPSSTQTVEEKHPLSPSATRPNAASLGFGQSHRGYFQYLHHSANGVIDRTQPSSSSSVSLNDPFHSSSMNRSSSTDGRIILPIAPHLLPTVTDGSSASSASASVSGAENGLALSVPYKLARFVPQDTRDGNGKKGHLNASGLGFGTGHRNHYKYLHDNREGDPELAYFRSNHCS